MGVTTTMSTVQTSDGRLWSWRKQWRRIFVGYLMTLYHLQRIHKVFEYLYILAPPCSPWVGTEKKASADKILTFTEISWKRNKVKCYLSTRYVYTIMALFSKIMLWSKFCQLCMGVKLGLTNWGRDAGWGCSRIGYWGRYEGISGKW
jgi:hypothetical protein